MLLISGIFGTAYMILYSFPYLGNYLFFGFPSYFPPVPFNFLSPNFITFCFSIISYIFLSLGVFFLSNMCKKVYYFKRRRLFYRGVLYLNTAYLVYLIGTVKTIFILILKWVFFKDYPTGELNAYMFTEYYLYLSLAAASIITKNKTVKKSENLTNDLTQQ